MSVYEFPIGDQRYEGDAGRITGKRNRDCGTINKDRGVPVATPRPRKGEVISKERGGRRFEQVCSNGHQAQSRKGGLSKDNEMDGRVERSFEADEPLREVASKCTHRILCLAHWIRKERSRTLRKKERRGWKKRFGKYKEMNGMLQSVFVPSSTTWVRTVQKWTRVYLGKRMWSSCHSVVNLPVFTPNC